MKTTQAKIELAILRSLGASQRGKNNFEKATRHLNRAIALGLKAGDIVKVGAQRFKLIDNVQELATKGRVYRPARLGQFEVKEVAQERPAKKKKGEENGAAVK